MVILIDFVDDPINGKVIYMDTNTLEIQKRRRKQQIQKYNSKYKRGVSSIIDNKKEERLKRF